VGSSYDDSAGGFFGLLLTETAGHWATAVETTPWGSNLHSVSCASAGNCTAVGVAQLFTQEAGQWAPGVYASSIAPAEPVSDVTAVSCAPDGSCSTVGYDYYDDGRDFYPGPPVLLSKEHGTWRRIDPVMPGNNPGEGINLSSVSCVSGGNCTVGGQYSVGIDSDQGGHGVLLTEKAGEWQTGVMALPPKNATDPYWANYVDLNGISCAAPEGCVAIGQYAASVDYPDRPTLLTEKAGKWRRGVEVSLPRDANGPAAFLSAVSCASPGNCTVVGGYRGGEDQYGLLLTEIAGRWAQGVSAPRFTGSFGSVLSVSCVSPGNCGAAGAGWWDPGGGPYFGVLFDSTTEPCVVPELRGKTLPRARHSIESHNCWIGTIEHAPSGTIETGHVISQTPKPGGQLAPGTKVNLKVSSGP
jgi:hypothetical protein